MGNCRSHRPMTRIHAQNSYSPTNSNIRTGKVQTCTKETPNHFASCDIVNVSPKINKRTSLFEKLPFTLTAKIRKKKSQRKKMRKKHGEMGRKKRKVIVVDHTRLCNNVVLRYFKVTLSLLFRYNYFH